MSYIRSIHVAYLPRKPFPSISSVSNVIVLIGPLACCALSIQACCVTLRLNRDIKKKSHLLILQYESLVYVLLFKHKFLCHTASDVRVPSLPALSYSVTCYIAGSISVYPETADQSILTGESWRNQSGQMFSVWAIKHRVIRAVKAGSDTGCCCCAKCSVLFVFFMNKGSLSLLNRASMMQKECRIKVNNLKSLTLVNSLFFSGLHEEVPKVSSDPCVCGQRDRQWEPKQRRIHHGDREAMCHWHRGPAAAKEGNSADLVCRFLDALLSVFWSILTFPLSASRSPVLTTFTLSKRTLWIAETGHSTSRFTMRLFPTESSFERRATTRWAQTRKRTGKKCFIWGHKHHLCFYKSIICMVQSPVDTRL